MEWIFQWSHATKKRDFPKLVQRSHLKITATIKPATTNSGERSLISTVGTLFEMSNIQQKLQGQKQEIMVHI